MSSAHEDEAPTVTQRTPESSRSGGVVVGMPLGGVAEQMEANECVAGHGGRQYGMPTHMVQCSDSCLAGASAHGRAGWCRCVIGNAG